MSLHLIRDLETLHRDLVSMCASVEGMIHKAVNSLSSPNEEIARELQQRDNEIDLWDVRIEDECLKILALHQPVAADLRRIATVFKISGELERVADLGVNISERCSALVRWPQVTPPDTLKQMAHVALDMLHRSLDAYVDLDSTVARHVIEHDDLVDEMNRKIIDELAAMMKQNAEQVEPAMHLFSATRHVERVADHATNIAEDVVYLVEGEIIRHGGGELLRDAQTSIGPEHVSRN